MKRSYPDIFFGAGAEFGAAERPFIRTSKRMDRREFLKLGGALALLNPLPGPLRYELDSLLSGDDCLKPQEGDSLSWLFSPLLRPELSRDENAEKPSPLFLTFDDGPLVCTEAILDRLAETRQSVTFFLIGRNLTNRRLRKLAVRAVREGHELGNHSYTHPRFSGISAGRAAKEIEKAHHLIQEVVEEGGGPPNHQNLFFRFPYADPGGSETYRACEEVLGHLGYRIAWWDLDTLDWRMAVAGSRRKPSRVIASLKKARPRDVVLLHDRKRTAGILPSLLEVLRSKKLSSVPLSAYLSLTPNPEGASAEEAAETVSATSPGRIIPYGFDELLAGRVRISYSGQGGWPRNRGKSLW